MTAVPARRQTVRAEYPRPGAATARQACAGGVIVAHDWYGPHRADSVSTCKPAYLAWETRLFSKGGEV
jgi:hypothetical protein